MNQSPSSPALTTASAAVSGAGIFPCYVTSVGKYKYEVQLRRWGGLPVYLFLHTIHGKGILIMENREYLIGNNTGFLIQPNVPHEYYPIEQPWGTQWLTFEGAGAESFCKTLGFKPFEIIHLPAPHCLDPIMARIYETTLTNDPARDLQAAELIAGFLLQLQQYKSEYNPSAGLQHRQLERVIAYINANYQKGPSLKEMAGLIGVSPQYLCSIFKNVLNMRPFEYITRLRLRKAKEMLIEGEESFSIQEIAHAVGYNDTSYFCYIFKKHESVTPLQFKKDYHKKR
ncbi:MAG: AraC family transcriptional regulator [Firmicutes bacterium]|nr:AraC family transcriptional regulator [Bacillota bacterium]